MLLLLNLTCPVYASATDKVQSAVTGEIDYKYIFSLASNMKETELFKLLEEYYKPEYRDKQIALNIALYITNPVKYESRYVEAFPQDSNAIMYIIFNQFELPQMTPSFLYSFDALGKIALKGNRLAVRKTILGSNNSDGVVAEELCFYCEKLFQSNLILIIEELSKLHVDERARFNYCILSMVNDDIYSLQQAVAKIITNDTKVKTVIEEIKSIKPLDVQ